MLHTRRSWCAAPVGVSTLRGRESHADAASDSASAWHPSDLVLRTDSRSPSTLRCTRSQICRLGLVRAGRVARGISGSSALPPRAPMRESQAMQGRPWRAARSWVAPLSFCSWTLTCWSQRRRSFPGERRSKRDGRSLIRVFRHEAKSTLPHLRGRGSQSQIVYTVCRMCATPCKHSMRQFVTWEMRRRSRPVRRSACVWVLSQSKTVCLSHRLFFTKCR